MAASSPFIHCFPQGGAAAHWDHRIEPRDRHESYQIVEIARSPVSVAVDRAPIGLIPCEGTRLTLRNEQSVRVPGPSSGRRDDSGVRASPFDHFAETPLPYGDVPRARSVNARAPHRVHRTRGHVLLAWRRMTVRRGAWSRCAIRPGRRRGDLRTALVRGSCLQGVGPRARSRGSADPIWRETQVSCEPSRTFCATTRRCSRWAARTTSPVVRSPYGATMLRLERDLQDAARTGKGWNPGGSAPRARPTEAFA